MKGSIKFTCKRRLRGTSIVSQFSWVVDIPEDCVSDLDVQRFIREQRLFWQYTGWLCKGVIRDTPVSEIERVMQGNL